MARSFAQFGRLPEGPRAPVDVGELARYTARATIPPSMESLVEIDDAVPMIDGHHDALARALSNVMLNAVDACRQCGDGEGRIDVRVRRAPIADRDAVEIAVRDTGCGIAPERLLRIWDPYMTSKPGGTGLGLAIARQTVLAHDGTVTAESTPGRGTEVRFVLPVNGSRNGNGATDGN
jgi:signal transduction histidine kinase